MLSKLDFKFPERNKIAQKQAILLYRANDKSYARLGVIVSKRNVSQAVSRNLIKRIVRESFRAHQSSLSGIDILVIARQQHDKMDTLKFREGIDLLWKKLMTQFQKSSSSLSKAIAT